MGWNWLEKMKVVMKNVLEKNVVEQSLAGQVLESAQMAEALRLWGALYENRAPWLDGQTASLNLPAAIASELARMVTIELQSAVQGGPRAVWLDKQYQRLLPQLRRQVEYGCAKGGVVLKPYLDGKGGLAVDFVQNDCFYPTVVDGGGQITGVVFVDRRQVGSDWFTKLERQELVGDVLHISNQAYRSQAPGQLGTPVPLAAIAAWAGLAPEVQLINMERPLFAYFKVPHANTVDAASPLGVSVYARAVQQIADADRQYSRALWEYEAGEMAVDADETLFRRDEAGNLLLPHGRERLFRVLTGIDDDGKKLNAWAPDLRDEALFRGLNEMLKRVEDLCGLARGTFASADGEAKTATELKILKQRSYATVTDLQAALQQALTDLVACMDALGSAYSLAPVGTYQLAFRWDDSIVVDAEAQRRQDLQEVEQGILQKWEYRVKWYGEDEMTARQRAGETVAAGVL